MSSNKSVPLRRTLIDFSISSNNKKGFVFDRNSEEIS